jgi:hypothetical protein
VAKFVANCLHIPKEVVDLIVQRTRKRIVALEGVRLSEYQTALHELREILDLLERASSYFERGQRKQ